MAKPKQTDQEFLASLAKLGDPRKFETDHIKRSGHSDFATASELKARKFSGWRHNTLIEEMELWVQGRVRGTVKIDPMTKTPDFDKMWLVEQEVFAQ